MLKEIKESAQLRALKARYPIGNAIAIIIAIVMLWRGVWGLLDTYFFPGSPTLSHFSCALLGVLVLYLDGFHIDNLKR